MVSSEELYGWKHQHLGLKRPEAEQNAKGPLEYQFSMIRKSLQLLKQNKGWIRGLKPKLQKQS